ncbi:hypothetical protein O9992_15250 [Vibrio lentus]|nr:hypothetical protein [Vibrio lentus]
MSLHAKSKRGWHRDVGALVLSAEPSSRQSLFRSKRHDWALFELAYQLEKRQAFSK